MKASTAAARATRGAWGTSGSVSHRSDIASGERVAA
jgi:hypothetical protein